MALPTPTSTWSGILIFPSLAVSVTRIPPYYCCARIVSTRTVCARKARPSPMAICLHSAVKTRFSSSADVSPNPSRSMSLVGRIVSPSHKSMSAAPFKMNCRRTPTMRGGTAGVHRQIETTSVGDPRRVPGCAGEAALEWTRRCSSAVASQHDRLKVRLHDTIDAELLRNAMKLVEIEPTTAPSLFERLQSDVKADRIAESKTVCNRASEAVDAHGVPFELMALDSLTEHRRRYPNGPKRRKTQTWYARAARYCNPDLMGELCPDIMKPQRREQANN